MAKWDKLSDIDRAKAILQIIESTFRLIGEMFPIIKALGTQAWNHRAVQKLCGQWNLRVGGEKGRVTVPVKDNEVPVLDNEKLGGVNSEAIEPTLEGQIGEVTSEPLAAEKLSIWAKAGKAGTVMLRSVVVLSNLAVVAGLGFQIEKEWGNEKAGIIALDIINLATVAVQVVVEIAEIGIAIIGMESTVLPLIGAVVAIVGIIIMFIKYDNPFLKFLEGLTNNIL